MKEITKENRLESYLQRPVNRQTAILEALDGSEMTARQIANKLGYFDLNAVKPRLTEMKKAGLIEVVGKAYDMATDRNTAVYARV